MATGDNGRVAENPQSDQERRRLAAAVTVCGRLKKMLAANRMYSSGHEMLEEFRAVLLAELGAFHSEFGDLVLDLSAHALSLDGKAVLKGEGRDGSISYPLFLDGLQRMTVAAGVTDAELSPFLALWSDALEGRSERGHTISTRLWEADFPHLRFIAAETFSEGDGTGDESKESRSREKDQLQALISEISGEKLAGGAQGTTARPKLMRVSREDLQLLKAGALADITAADLERQDVSRRPPMSGVAPAEAAAFVAELERDGSAADRTIQGIATMALGARADDRPRLLGVVSQVFVAHAGAGRLQELAELVERIEESVQTAHVAWEQRMVLLEELRAVLEGPEVLAPVIGAMDDPAAMDGASAVLRYVRPVSAGMLLERLALLQSAGGRRALASVVGLLRPSPSDLSLRLRTCGPELAREILLIADSYPADAQRQIKLAGLESTEPAVRWSVVSGLRKKDLEPMRDALFAMLDDAEPSIRSAMLKLLTASRDPQVVTAVSRMLEGTRPDAAERKTLLLALGSFGAVASAAVRREIGAAKDPEVVAAAILVLVQTDGEGAREELTRMSGRFLERRAVKDACREALRRLDVGKTASVTPKPEPEADAGGAKRAPLPGITYAYARGKAELVAVEAALAPPAPTGLDRRADPRFSRVMLEAKVQLGTEIQDSRLYVTDLSKHGAFVETASPAPVGSMVRVLIAVMPGKVLPLDARVVRAVAAADAAKASSIPGMGVRFESLNAASRELLDRALESASAPPAPEIAPDPTPDALVAEAGVSAEARPSFLVRRLASKLKREIDERKQKARELLASGREAFDSGMFAKASADLQLAQMYDPDDREVRQLAIRAAAKAGVSRAGSAFSQGERAEQNGDRDTAVRSFYEAAALDPRNPKYCRKAGECALASGDAHAARKFLVAALAAGGRDPDVHALLARAYAMAGLARNAVREAEQAMDLDPGRPELRALLKEMRKL